MIRSLSRRLLALPSARPRSSLRMASSTSDSPPPPPPPPSSGGEGEGASDRKQDVAKIGGEQQLCDSEVSRRPPVVADMPARDIFSRYPPAKGGVIREAWVETLNAEGPTKTGEVIRLHPDVWSVKPRLDIIKQNVEWQMWYKYMSYAHAKSRHEMPPQPTPGRPWPLKGTGRARHATVRSPIWNEGGKAHGPRGVKTWYYNLDYTIRVQGLIHTLAVKFAQDDVRIVKNLEVPSNDSTYLEQLVDGRSWEITTLFVDAGDEFPPNITEATDGIFHMNMMPVYGLNVHSMLKHKTLVLTVPAVNLLEEKLLFAQRRLDIVDKRYRSNNVEESLYNKMR